jgi:hypothetical protein
MARDKFGGKKFTMLVGTKNLNLTVSEKKKILT